MSLTNVLDIVLNCSFLVIALMLIFILFEIIQRIIVKSDNITKEELELIELGVKQAVEYAEQLYKNDKLVDRYKIALDYIFLITQKAGYDYGNWLKVIKGLIESQVFKLPKTHEPSVN